MIVVVNNTKEMSVAEASIIYHIATVLALLWTLSYFGCCHSIVYFVCLVYLYQVHGHYIIRLRKKLQFEERKQAFQRRLLSDSETVRWLNHAVEKIWPVCMEHIASQKILLPIIPWFLEKYKPWTAKKAVFQHLYLGRNPPLFTEIRVLRESSDDDHLVLELGMNFLTSDDMSAILAVKLRRRLGFGMWAKMHITGMHVEGKVLVGLKFLPEWPFLGRLRLCFVEPPYFQMTVKPIVNHGLNVTEIPGIAGWLDKLLAIAFEQTLVEPNMLIVDMEKFATATTEKWFFFDAIDPIAYAKVEVVEAADMKPSDPNGLADPYVKGNLGPYRFQTKIQKKTLTPKWLEEFKIPICTWDSPNFLALEVRDKDHFVDDTLGNCSVNIGNFRDGHRHDMWLSLENIKMGRLRIAVTVLSVDRKEEDQIYKKESSNKRESPDFVGTETTQEVSKSMRKSSNKAQTMPDELEPINIEGQQQTGIWVHHPGSDVSQTWEPRKSKTREADIEILSKGNNLMEDIASGNGSSSNNESADEKKSKSHHRVRRSLQKITSAFTRSPRMTESMLGEAVQSPHANLRATNETSTSIKFVVDDSIPGSLKGSKTGKESSRPERNEATSPRKGYMRDRAKSIIKHAEHGLKHVLSRKRSNKLIEVDKEQDSDSSEDDSSLSSSLQCSPSPRADAVVNDSVALFVNGSESLNPTGNDPKVGTCDSAKNLQEVSVIGTSHENTDGKTISSFDDVHCEAPSNLYLDVKNSSLEAEER